MKKKTVVAIVVYDRFHNVDHWLNCWEKCDHNGAELVVIHNDDGDERYSDLCKKHGVKYIRHINIGYDIGRFQDLCRGRLEDFPEWDRVLWIVDDSLPMAFDFVKQFEDAMKPGVGVACMEVSPHVTKHIRTTGFMIDKSTAQKLEFPADPVTSKNHCFHFEHRANKKIFYGQIVQMNLKVVMVADKQNSPLWDIGYHRRLDRKAEHEAKFGKFKTYDKVLFICPIYKTYPQIISSMLLQTHENWQLLLVHDGPDTENVKKIVPDDPRITFMATKKRGGCWGHYIRQTALREKQDEADFVVITNADNYYTPVFTEYLIKGFERHPRAIATYCSQMVHSYVSWKILPCSLNVGFIDCGGVMLKMKPAAAVGWNDITTHSADWAFFYDLIQAYGADKFIKVEGCLFIHN